MAATTTRSNWHTPCQTEAPVEDPFDEVSIEDVGRAIDLRNRRDVLNARLRELMRREGKLFDATITCSLKDDAEASCTACPISKAGMKGERLAPLCSTGKEQDQVLTELRLLSLRERGQIT